MVLQDKELVKYSAVFILLYGLMDTKNFKGRRIIKKIIKSLKKKIAISKNSYKNKKEWLYYVEQGQNVIVLSNDKMILEEVDLRNSIVSPSIVLNRIFDRTSFCTENNIPIKDLEELDDIYKNTKSYFTSVVFTNRLKEAIKKVKLYKE